MTLTLSCPRAALRLALGWYPPGRWPEYLSGLVSTIMVFGAKRTHQSPLFHRRPYRPYLDSRIARSRAPQRSRCGLRNHLRRNPFASRGATGWEHSWNNGTSSWGIGRRVAGRKLLDCAGPEFMGNARGHSAFSLSCGRFNQFGHVRSTARWGIFISAIISATRWQFARHSPKNLKKHGEELIPPAGFEPATDGLEIRQLLSGVLV